MPFDALPEKADKDLLLLAQIRDGVGSGWIQGSYGTYEHCLVGWINQVAYKAMIEMTYDLRGQRTDLGLRVTNLNDHLIDLLYDALPRSYRRVRSKQRCLESYNDRKTTTKAAIIKLIDRAVEKITEEASHAVR